MNSAGLARRVPETSFYVAIACHHFLRCASMFSTEHRWVYFSIQCETDIFVIAIYDITAVGLPTTCSTCSASFCFTLLESAQCIIQNVSFSRLNMNLSFPSGNLSWQLRYSPEMPSPGDVKNLRSGSSLHGLERPCTSAYYLTLA